MHATYEKLKDVKKSLQQMTSKERVTKTLRHEEPDRIPVSDQLIVSRVASKILGRYAYTGGGEWNRDLVKALFLGERDSFVEQYTHDILELHDNLGLDFINVRRVPPKQIDSDDLPEKVAPNTYRYHDKEADIFSIFQYNPLSGEFFVIDSSFRQEGLLAIERYTKVLEKRLSRPVKFPEGTFEALDKVVKKVGKKISVAFGATLWIPMEPNWLEAVALKPELVEIELDYQLEQAIFLIKEGAKRGADFVLGGGDLATNKGPIYSPIIFRRIVLPRFKKLVEISHQYKLPYIFRTDGNTKLIWKELFEDLGVDGYGEIDKQAGMDIGQLKEKFGSEITLLGGICCATTLVSGSKNEIFSEVKSCIEKAGKGGGFILTSSNSIHYGVPAKNFLYMIEAAYRYGQYPISKSVENNIV